MASMTPEELERVRAAVAATWRSVLSRNAIGYEENFFDAGGNSFQLLMVKDRLDAMLGVRTDLVAFFRHPTISQITHHIYGVKS
ncbi:phosphopantetheine-binding protein [Nocardia sp. NPDC005978]|uniref:phosphopantetheine-binding protein n=1 Tax=unclassified Nocardia TaxID=2637762 RepID=UPI0033AB0C4D